MVGHPRSKFYRGAKMKHPLPLGFGFALAQNAEAMKFFSGLAEEKQAEILQQAQNVSSKSEMQALVDSLSVKN